MNNYNFIVAFVSCVNHATQACGVHFVASEVVMMYLLFTLEGPKYFL